MTGSPCSARRLTLHGRAGDAPRRHQGVTRRIAESHPAWQSAAMPIARAAFSIVPALLLAGCISLPRQAEPQAGAPPFPVAAFFSGATEGEGTLRVITRSPRAIRVTSHGRVGADGTVIVEQRIEEEGRRPRTRSWHLREVAPGRLEGALTDAAGPVTGEILPGELRLSFRMKDGMQAHQRLVLARDGRSAHNILTVSRFGLRLAVLDERIRRLEDQSERTP